MRLKTTPWARGGIAINSPIYNEKAEILREKGTNRSKFYRGQVDKYTWVDFGDSYLPSELNAAYLWAQLIRAEEINFIRRKIWYQYERELKPFADRGFFSIPYVPHECVHNGHLYYIKLRDVEERTKFINHMNRNGISTVFHYIPLHSSPAGKKYGRFFGADKYTTRESERLVRLPLYYGLSETDQKKIISCLKAFFLETK